MNSEPSLQDRVVAVTGAAGGLGSAHARLLAEHGASLVLNDLGTDRSGAGSDTAAVERVVDEVRDAGAEAVGNSADIATMDGARSLLDDAVAAFGRVDALVNSGGLLRDSMFVSMEPEQWDAVVRGHLRAHFCPTRVCAAHWRERAKAGEDLDASVVNTTSNAGLFVQPGQSNYAAAKAGIAGLTLTLAAELERYGVRVNAISPAARTRMTTEVPGMAEVVAEPDDPDEFDTFDPANVSPVVAWLVAADCSATGQVLFVRGRQLRILEGWRYADTLEADDGWTVGALRARLADRRWERAPRA